MLKRKAKKVCDNFEYMLSDLVLKLVDEYDTGMIGICDTTTVNLLQSTVLRPSQQLPVNEQEARIEDGELVNTERHRQEEERH